MEKDTSSNMVYEKLREHLDSLPVGFSKTKSGVEIDILKKIFEPEEEISPLPDSVGKILREWSEERGFGEKE